MTSSVSIQISCHPSSLNTPEAHPPLLSHLNFTPLHILWASVPDHPFVPLQLPLPSNTLPTYRTPSALTHPCHSTIPVHCFRSPFPFTSVHADIISPASPFTDSMHDHPPPSAIRHRISTSNILVTTRTDTISPPQPLRPWSVTFGGALRKESFGLKVTSWQRWSTFQPWRLTGVVVVVPELCSKAFFWESSNDHS